MKLVLSLLCLVGTVLAVPGKVKRDILPGDPRYGTDYHHHHHHHPSGDGVEVSRAVGGYTGSYGVPAVRYGPPNHEPGQPISNYVGDTPNVQEHHHVEQHDHVPEQSHVPELHHAVQEQHYHHVQQPTRTYLSPQGQQKQYLAPVAPQQPVNPQVHVPNNQELPLSTQAQTYQHPAPQEPIYLTPAPETETYLTPVPDTETYLTPVPETQDHQEQAPRQENHQAPDQAQTYQAQRETYQAPDQIQNYQAQRGTYQAPDQVRVYQAQPGTYQAPGQVRLYQAPVQGQNPSFPGTSYGVPFRTYGPPFRTVYVQSGGRAAEVSPVPEQQPNPQVPEQKPNPQVPEQKPNPQVPEQKPNPPPNQRPPQGFPNFPNFLPQFPPFQLPNLANTRPGQAFLGTIDSIGQSYQNFVSNLGSGINSALHGFGVETSNALQRAHQQHQQYQAPVYPESVVIENAENPRYTTYHSQQSQLIAANGGYAY